MNTKPCIYDICRSRCMTNCKPKKARRDGHERAIIVIEVLRESYRNKNKTKLLELAF